MEEILADSGIDYHVVTARCKDLDSLRVKLRSKAYRRPSVQVTDKVGVRVVTYYENDVSPVVRALRNQLEIDEHKSGDKRLSLGLREFGYLSVHLIARTPGPECHFRT